MLCVRHSGSERRVHPSMWLAARVALRYTPHKIPLLSTNMYVYDIHEHKAGALWRTKVEIIPLTQTDTLHYHAPACA